MVGTLRFARPNVLVDRREEPSEPYSGVFPMANLDDLRKHVLDDAHELVATAGMLMPLIESSTDELVKRLLHQDFCVNFYLVTWHL
jgi:hypothetical protein